MPSSGSKTVPSAAITSASLGPGRRTRATRDGGRGDAARLPRDQEPREVREHHDRHFLQLVAAWCSRPRKMMYPTD